MRGSIEKFVGLDGDTEVISLISHYFTDCHVRCVSIHARFFCHFLATFANCCGISFAGEVVYGRL